MKITLLEWAFALSVPASEKTQYFVHLSFNSTLLLINSISSDLQKLLKYFITTAIVSFFRFPFGPLTSVISDNLAFHLINSSVFAISPLTSVA